MSPAGAHRGVPFQLGSMSLMLRARTMTWGRCSKVECIMGNGSLPPLIRMMDRHNWKYYLPTTSLAGRKYIRHKLRPPFQQACIPVGCVPSAAVAIWRAGGRNGCLVLGGGWPEDGCLVWEWVSCLVWGGGVRPTPRRNSGRRPLLCEQTNAVCGR